jgi:hypothetical protein
MKRMGLARKNSKSSSHSTIDVVRGGRFRFAVCVDNTGYPASLERGKLYRVIPDADAAAHGYLRIVDEDGEDYAYAARRFFAVNIPRTLERSLAQFPSAQTAR